MKNFKETLLKRVLPIAVSVIVPISAFSACSKKGEETPVTTTNVSSSLNEDEVVTSVTVYVYKKPTFVSYVAVNAQVGSKIKLAQNDEIASDAYSAMNGEFDVSLSDNTFVKPGDEVTVSAIAYVDEEGNVKLSYKNGTKIENLPLAYDESGKERVAYQVSDANGNVLGYTSYNGNELKLYQDMIVETSCQEEVPEGFEFFDSYKETATESKHFNGVYTKGETYVLK